MSLAAHNNLASNRQDRLAPRPTSLDETGLSDAFVTELIVKHLYEGGALSMHELCNRIKLPGTIVEQQVTFLRREARVEIRTGSQTRQSFGLTDKGRVSALDALMRSGYVGPAPVPLAQYKEVALAQTVHAGLTNRERMKEAFDGVVLGQLLLDQLGSAMNSGRAIFIYGPAGTGKTYITQRLARLLSDTILLPYAISIGEIVIEVFDPTLHKRINPTNSSEKRSLALDFGHDERFVSCGRPVAIAGGELTLDMLEVVYDPARKTYRAPLQLNANNGLLIIDDMGRQRVSPADLFNRWIVPMEESRDYLHLGTGMHFAVPFDVILIFSTNLNPLDLADEAFLRRIGYKIHFDYLTPSDYTLIWRQVCGEFGIEFDPALVQFVLSELHGRYNVPLLPCHPRDLLCMAIDHAAYFGEAGNVTVGRLQWAWENYFVSLDTQADPQTLRDKR